VFDELSNKNIVYCARDALVTIGYTGCAYIGSMPTDQWIAEKLTGKDFQSLPRRNHNFGIALGGFLNPWLDIGLSLLRLEEALNHAQDQIPIDWHGAWNKMPFEVIVSGYQWKKNGRFRPIGATISKTSGSQKFELGYFNRDLLEPGKYLVVGAPTGNVLLDDLRQIVDSISKAPAYEIEAAFVELTRKVSKENSVVGPHCMSILITPPHIGQVRIRLIPYTEHFAILSSAHGKEIKICAYSPWLIGPNTCSGPAIISGTMEMPLGHYMASLEAPYNVGPISGFFFSQKRKTP